MAYGNLYRRATRGLDEAAHARIDALLGLEGAAIQYAAVRRRATSASGFEVG